MHPLWTFEKTTSLTIPEAEEILLNIQEGSFAGADLPFILKGTGNSCSIKKVNNRFEALFDDGHKSFVNADYSNHSLTLQGEWWFKAIYTLTKQDNKTLITASIYNAADKLPWFAWLMQKNKKENYKNSFYKFVESMEREYLNLTE